jgi:hypothetical protein
MRTFLRAVVIAATLLLFAACGSSGDQDKYALSECDWMITDAGELDDSIGREEYDQCIEDANTIYGTLEAACETRWRDLGASSEANCVENIYEEHVDADGNEIDPQRLGDNEN